MDRVATPQPFQMPSRRNDRHAGGLADVIDDGLSVGGNGVIGGNIDHIASVGSALADGATIVGVGEGVILAGVARSSKLAFTVST